MPKLHLENNSASVSRNALLPKEQDHDSTANFALCWLCYGYVNDVYGANALDA